MPIKDTDKPVISGAANKTIKLNSSFNPKTNVSAKDNADGSLTSKIKVAGTVNTKKKGMYTLKYTVTDQSKNVTTVTRKITIDSTKPVISGAKSKTISNNSSFNPKSGVTAKDNLDGSLTSKIKITGTVDTKKKRYLYTDLYGYG
ncbi:immunoglobulin-like domain-containing protein [Peribacillus sp. NPDC060186]